MLSIVQPTSHLPEVKGLDEEGVERIERKENKKRIFANREEG